VRLARLADCGPAVVQQPPALEDWRWGTGTARQRLLHRLAVVAALGADHPELAGLALVSSAMRNRILQRWSGTGPLPAADGDPLR
jgi:hypothetical protein